MLSNHYPLATGTQHTWLIASLVFLMGVSIRHYFNQNHARAGNPTWTWLVTALIFIVLMWLSIAPALRDDTATAALSPQAERFAQAQGFDAVHDIVVGRCSMCHAAEPGYPGLWWAPKGVVLETEAQIAMAARQIYLHSAVSHAIPPANLSWMEQEERDGIAAWYRAATQG